MSDDQTKNSFSLRVETYALQEDTLLISALAVLCEDYGIEPTKAPNYINRGLKEKIQIEAEDLRMLKPENAERPTLFID